MVVMLMFEVRAGEGGDHSMRFARTLFDAAAVRVRRTGGSFVPRTVDGRTLVADMSPDSDMAALAGTHRIQGLSGPTGKRHTSTVTVAVLEPSTVPVI